MIGIFAARGYAVQVAECGIVIPARKGDIPHPDIVTLASPSVEGPVIDPLESLTRPGVFSPGAEQRGLGEAQVVFIDRPGITLAELRQRPAGILPPELHAAGREQVIDLLFGHAVIARKPFAGLEQFIPGVGPPAPFVKRTTARQMLLHRGYRSGDGKESEAEHIKKDDDLLHKPKGIVRTNIRNFPVHAAVPGTILAACGEKQNLRP